MTGEPCCTARLVVACTSFVCWLPYLLRSRSSFSHISNRYKYSFVSLSHSDSVSSLGRILVIFFFSWVKWRTAICYFAFHVVLLTRAWMLIPVWRVIWMTDCNIFSFHVLIWRSSAPASVGVVFHWALLWLVLTRGRELLWSDGLGVLGAIPWECSTWISWALGHLPAPCESITLDFSDIHVMGHIIIQS